MALASHLPAGARGTQNALGWLRQLRGLSSAAAGPARGDGKGSGSERDAPEASSSSSQASDPFTASLQHKTEEQLLRFVLKQDEATAVTAADSRPSGSPSGDSGVQGGSKAARAPHGKQEIGGYAGPEPTRYKDWEIKGRCSDF